MNFAHGGVVVAAGYLQYTLYSLVGIPFLVAGLLSVVLSGLVGVALYRGIYKRLLDRKSSSVVLMIASLGLLIFLLNLLQLLFGATVQSYNYLPIQNGIAIFGASVTVLQLGIIGISGLLFLFLYIVLYRTRLGRTMRAVAESRELASVVGIDREYVADASFFIGSCLAGFAGILIGLEQNLNPAMGTMLVVEAFTGSVVGGLLSAPASIAGSYLLGFAENVGIWFLPSGYKPAIAFGLLFVFLLFFPEGLFGIRRGSKQ